MEVLVDHLGDVQFEITARGHKIWCDQPAENGGHDEGMAPPELLLASLGACAGYYAVQYLRSRKLSNNGMRIRVTAEKATAPARLSDFTIEIHMPEKMEERHEQGLLRAVKTCLIHNTLLQPPNIVTKIVAPVRT